MTTTHKQVESWNARANEYAMQKRSASNNVAPIPDVLDPTRREACRVSFRLFCESYFPNRFFLKWSKGHIETLETMQHAVVSGGGYYAFADPRGDGKTSRSEVLALWALLYGYRKFVVCVGATADAAKELFSSVFTELETNEYLDADFPEVCYPLRSLGGAYIRARSQHLDGVRTSQIITTDRYVFPYIEGSPSAGAIVKCASITGRIRGLKQTVVNTGEVLRPDFVIIDDPQTDKSAKSARQVAQRERAVTATICGLAGPDKSITAVMPCTVIEQDDLADRFLDQERRPDWRGKRTSMLQQFPENMELWQEYQEVRAQGFRDGLDVEPGNKFYAANREAMDMGAVVSWEQRYDRNKELSAIQHAMNLYLKDPSAFASEYQNKPLIQSKDAGDTIKLSAKEVIQRISHTPALRVPLDTEFVTTGIDIQQEILYYLTVAWRKNFGGVIIDYGAFPEQRIAYYTADSPRFPLSAEYPGILLSPRVYAGLQRLETYLTNQIYLSVEGADTRYIIDRVLIDAAWNEISDAVYNFCAGKEKFHPSEGKGITASSLPMATWPKRQGDKLGRNWRTRRTPSRAYHTLIDTNYWKSRAAERLACHVSSAHAITMWGSKPFHHQLLADHLTSEYAVKTQGRGRAVNEWRLTASGQENHWFDCLVMAMVAASQCGLELHDMLTDTEDGATTAPSKPKPKREPLDISKL